MALHPGYGRLMEHRGRSLRIFWSSRMVDDLRRFYPDTLNSELAGMFGVSPRTVVRKARELGLEKDRGWLASVWEERRMLARAASKKRGWPGAFRKGNTTGAEYRFKPGNRKKV